MSKAERSIQIVLFFMFYACLVSLAYSAYGTIEKVGISAPSSARIGEPVDVRATVHTVRSGWGSCTVRDVRAVLTITPEGTTISGDNPCEIGSLSDGSSGVASWTLEFKENRTYTLQVQASGYDSNGSPCNSIESATVIVGGGTPITLFDNGYVLLIFVGAILVTAAVAVALLLRRRNKPKSWAPNQS